MSPSIALVGDRNPEYPTHRALDATGLPWMATNAIDLDGVAGVWLAPGTPYRDDDAVFAMLRQVRESRLPFLGTCGGFQYASVEFARNVAGIDGAAHAEVDTDADDPVVARLSCSLVGEEREVRCVPGTRLAGICGTAPFTGFHWCNYGLNERWIEALQEAGLTVSARAADAGVEGFEVRDHPFYMATLFQPQMQGPGHPLIEAFCAAVRSPR